MIWIIVGVALWLLGSAVLIVGLCRAAKRGDRGLDRRRAEMRRLRGY
jgi:hypothetical protein